MPIELTDDEQRLLLEVLSDELGRLKAEINRTETTAFREELRAREATLVAMIDRLQTAVGAS